MGDELRVPWLSRAAAVVASAAVLTIAGCARHVTAPDPEAAEDLPPPSAELSEVRFDEQSPYGRVIVMDTGRLRCLKFSMKGGDQSCKDMKVPSRVVHEYARFLTVGLLFAPPSPRTLMVGLGGGSAVRMFLDQDPRIQMDVVEINPVVVKVAKQYFGVVPSERLRIHVADGRAFFADRSDRWDMVVLDAFGNDFIPFQLTTEEFLRGVAEHLSEDGAVVANLWTRNDRLYRAMVKTYTSVFPTVHTFKAVRAGNSILVATARPSTESCQQIQERARAQAKEMSFSFSFTVPAGQCRSAAELDLSDVQALTDDKRKEFDQLGHL